MNYRTTQVALFSMACCLVFLFLPSISADAQCRRELNGTGVGSDIAVPGEPGPECDLAPQPFCCAQPEPEVTREPAVIEPEPVVVEPESEPIVEIPAPTPAPYEDVEEIVVEEIYLPATAGELPLLALIGLIALAGAASLRRFAAKSSR